VFCLFFWLLAASSSAQTTQPDLRTVLNRAGVYVTHFYEQLSGIVAEEQYLQNWQRGGRLKNPPPFETRHLHSDLALVHASASEEWLQFRDIFEVDGRPVRDRAERLTKLFLDPSVATGDQVSRIKADSARYNLGDIVRNLNTPLLALTILMPSQQHRFRFKRSSKRDTATINLSPDTTGVFHTSTEVWIVEYDEVSHPTLIRTGFPVTNKDIEAHGRFWIEPDTGRVLMTELRVGDRHIGGTIDVSYQSEPLLGLLVPVEMREEYSNDAGSHVTGIATYGKFRQFQVNVDQTFLIKK